MSVGGRSRQIDPILKYFTMLGSYSIVIVLFKS